MIYPIILPPDLSTASQPSPSHTNQKIGIISRLVGQIFDESLPRARKERQIAPQASAGDPLSINPLLAIRPWSGLLDKAQRGRDKSETRLYEKAPEK